jgi:hypothetical protein
VALRLALLALPAGFCAPLCGPAAAQVSGTNLLLGQVGNQPGLVPKNRQDLYDELELDGSFGQARIGLRFESDRNSELRNPYAGISQRWVDWSEGPARVRVGNFYAILGRGLVHRSFELPGVVLDAVGLRSRFAFARDVDGALAEWGAGPVHALAFSGAPNAGENSLATPTEQRYRGQLSGAEVSGSAGTHARLGATYARSSAGLSAVEESGSGFLDVDPLGLLGASTVSLPTYFEYAQTNGTVGDWWKLRRGGGTPHALYASTGLLWRRLGLSAEWKDYAGFRKGTNDPPSLVREQSYVLLNRNTHVLDAGYETGYQLEVSYGLADAVTATANVSRADGARLNRYRERFVELRLGPTEARAWDGAAFYDAGEDRLSALDDSRVAGVTGGARFSGGWSAHVDLEAQRASQTRGALPPIRFADLAAALTVARADRGSASVTWDRTSDPLVRSVFTGGGAYLHLVNVVLGARLSPRQDATLTFGRSRGGRACTAGTCYEVPPFEGAELRLLSRF